MNKLLILIIFLISIYFLSKIAEKMTDNDETDIYKQGILGAIIPKGGKTLSYENDLNRCITIPDNFQLSVVPGTLESIPIKYYSDEKCEVETTDKTNYFRFIFTIPTEDQTENQTETS